jgi:NAD(P)-dependent dehydrogenase (short-subunit alcohol dehydrogenase family)
LAQDKILVNALCPGWVDTEMAHEGLRAFSETLKITKEKAFDQAMADVPLGKMSTPDEIAQLIVFLISDAQTSITGQTLDINNGAMMP